MTRSETLSLEPLADFSAALDGMAVVGSALDADRNLLLTACEDASEYREVHPSGRASFGRSRSSKHHHLAGLRIRNGTIDRFVVATEHLNAHFYAPLPNGEFLFASARCGRDPSRNCGNAHLFSSDGSALREISRNRTDLLEPR